MRKAILLGVLGLFLASSAAFAGEGCSWGSATSASNGAPDQTAATGGTTSTSKPATKDVKG